MFSCSENSPRRNDYHPTLQGACSWILFFIGRLVLTVTDIIIEALSGGLAYNSCHAPLNHDDRGLFPEAY